MEVCAPEDQATEAPLNCTQCGGGEIEPGFRLPLCGRCRTLLARRPFPPWLRISCLFLLAIMVFAGVRSINSFRAGIAFERGKQAERQRDYAAAAECYQRVVDRFPDSTLALARLAIARYRAKQLPEAAQALNRLSGRKTSRELASEVNEVIQSLKELAAENSR